MYIEFYYCDLETIESSTFDGLHLHSLCLYVNNLKSLPENIFIFQFSLQTLDLHNNQLRTHLFFELF